MLSIYSLMIPVISDGESTGFGGRSAGMGNISASLTDIWSVFNNQAGMAWQSGWQAGLFAESRFLIKELSLKAFSVMYSGKPGAFGIGVTHFGDARYSHIKTGFGYARKFGGHFSAGVLLDYSHFSLAEGYGTKGCISFEAGIIYKPAKEWMFGFNLVNPVPIRITETPAEWLPILIRLGGSWSISGKALVTIEIEKELNDKPVIKGGVEVKLVKRMMIRMGIRSNPFEATGGAGLTWGRIGIDLAAGYHPVLGFSPAISISYLIIDK